MAIQNTTAAKWAHEAVEELHVSADPTMNVERATLAATRALAFAQLANAELLDDIRFAIERD